MQSFQVHPSNQLLSESHRYGKIQTSIVVSEQGRTRFIDVKIQFYCYHSQSSIHPPLRPGMAAWNERINNSSSFATPSRTDESLVVVRAQWEWRISGKQRCEQFNNNKLLRFRYRRPAPRITCQILCVSAFYAALLSANTTLSNLASGGTHIQS